MNTTWTDVYGSVNEQQATIADVGVGIVLEDGAWHFYLLDTLDELFLLSATTVEAAQAEVEAYVLQKK